MAKEKKIATSVSDEPSAKELQKLRSFAKELLSNCGIQEASRIAKMTPSAIMAFAGAYTRTQGRSLENLRAVFKKYSGKAPAKKTEKGDEKPAKSAKPKTVKSKAKKVSKKRAKSRKSSTQPPAPSDPSSEEEPEAAE